MSNPESMLKKCRYCKQPLGTCDCYETMLPHVLADIQDRFELMVHSMDALRKKIEKMENNLGIAMDNIKVDTRNIDFSAVFEDLGIIGAFKPLSTLDLKLRELAVQNTVLDTKINGLLKELKSKTNIVTRDTTEVHLVDNQLMKALNDFHADLILAKQAQDKEQSLTISKFRNNFEEDYQYRMFGQILLTIVLEFEKQDMYWYLSRLEELCGSHYIAGQLGQTLSSFKEYWQSVVNKKQRNGDYNSKVSIKDHAQSINAFFTALSLIEPENMKKHDIGL